MNVSRRHHTPDLAETWERFKSARGQVLRDWVEAERALANARAAGSGDVEEGDRLLSAEAALQGAIMDFAAAADRESDPTPTALGLLRLAEHVLDEGGGGGAGPEKRLRQRRTGADRRRGGRGQR
jgi:hypothetical protein